MNVSGFDVLSIGETMAMLVADAPGPLAQAQHFSKRLAGADTNVAIGLARLGLRVGWISRLGADSFGAYVRTSIEAEGIDTSHVETDPMRSTGFMLKTRSVEGRDPAIEYYRRGSAASQLGPQHFDAAWALPGIEEGRLLTGRDTPDAFAVGIISARLEGRSWPDALRRANWIASRALQVVGDMEGLPMRHELPATY